MNLPDLYLKRDRLTAQLIRHRSQHRAFAVIQHKLTQLTAKIIRAEIRQGRHEQKEAA